MAYKNLSFLNIGAYVPLTNEGNIMVDGVLASCYAFEHHDLAHFGMAPLRWFPEVTGWIFGEDNGYQVFAEITKSFWELSLGILN